MDKQKTPKVQFRVLIIGRANAGKTTILQRVCETTDSPIIYRGKEQVKLDLSMERGEHTINDELLFSNHKGYVFHDSRGVEAGSTEELGILQEFIRRKCRERHLKDRLHAIWFELSVLRLADCYADGHLDLKYYKDICPDKNVPVIAVFTKYDQFLRNVKIHLEDYGNPGDIVSDVAEKQFQEHYLQPLGDCVRCVRLEKMHRHISRCDDLIEKTAVSLNEDVVALMLLAVQRANLGLSVNLAWKRVNTGLEGKSKQDIVRDCLSSFPYVWLVSNGSYLTF
ncbi:hypothetical protein EI94DRAFT_1805659 [Lactarius quietus]|nr:hypothetical protein EI94DRAFT_1805659 [Lactarius quietus]